MLSQPVTQHPASVDAYIRHGWSLVPIPQGTKGPKTPNWNQRTAALPQRWSVRAAGRGGFARRSLLAHKTAASLPAPLLHSGGDSRGHSRPAPSPRDAQFGSCGGSHRGSSGSEGPNDSDSGEDYGGATRTCLVILKSARKLRRQFDRDYC
jgi:hypothetical protein